MKSKVILALFVIVLFSCKEKSIETSKEEVIEIPKKFLPFQKVSLDDLSAFQKTGDNWKIAGSAYVDRSKDKLILSEEGTGILLNRPDEDSRANLFGDFEHGDIELEIDVMMPKGSNSGLYFQGRYEVQLFDSWGVREPRHSDMGGIYQRWDSTRTKGNEGYEGVAPRMNAAKAPGLWQHFKIIFHAPEFNSSGEKIKNALFEEVWLNGVLIHENIELTGPTRAAAFKDEKPMGPLMIQGDHGPVAFKNIKYKTYSGKKITLSKIRMAEYESTGVSIPGFDSLVPIRTIACDSISSNMVSGVRTRRVLKYDGEMVIPHSGNYLFNFNVHEGGGQFILNDDILINLDGNYTLDSLGLAKIDLAKGTLPFTLIYNRHNPWVKGFTLEVEGPDIQKQSLTAPMSLDLKKGQPDENIMIEVTDEVIAQRSFLMHDGLKRTHCTSIGTPEKIHYAYDLASGSLLQVWNGDFLDATPMWHGRGQKQLAIPAGFTVSFHGDPEFVQLRNAEAVWPEMPSEDSDYRQLGYEFDMTGFPVFTSQVWGRKISNQLVPSKTLRILHRSIAVGDGKELWHKVAEGESIEKLPDGAFIVNDESYFIDFSDSENWNPMVRESTGKDELLVKVPSGDHLLEYSIIW